MWEEYTENEFKSMGNFWGIMPNKRYSVQLTDKKFNAIINEPVFLVHKETGDTAWRAITDNTGEAELWEGFFKNSKDGSGYYIGDRYGNKVQQPSAFANGVNLLTADRTCGVTNEVDIAFVVDATGSMGDEIEFLKLELEDVIRNTMEKHKSLSLRAGSVFYRDKGDQYITKNVAFHDDLLKTLNFIKLQSAGGGGDTPEAVDEALSTALDSLQWNPNARTRLLFLVLDAPGTTILEVASPSPFKILLSETPVLVLIHSSLVSTIFSRSKLVSLSSGTYPPTAVMAAVIFLFM